MKYRKARYNRFGTIDCEINHPTLGWIPFTADANDVEELGRSIHAAASKGKVADFVEPEVGAPSLDPNDYPLKRWQFKAMVDYLGKASAIESAISAIDDPLRRAVVMARYKESDVYDRADPLFEELAPAVGLTSDDLDAAWLQIANGG